jgi:hypothetical protein
MENDRTATEAGAGGGWFCRIVGPAGNPEP